MGTNTTQVTDAEGKVTTTVQKWEDEAKTKWTGFHNFLAISLSHAETFGSAAWKIALGYAIAHSSGLGALIHSLM